MTTPPSGRPASEPSSTSLAALVAPDDWRLYHLMRELPDEDRARVIAFAELLFNLRLARRWAEGSESDDWSFRAERAPAVSPSEGISPSEVEAAAES